MNSDSKKASFLNTEANSFVPAKKNSSATNDKSPQ
jgi:hypothetical protein